MKFQPCSPHWALSALCVIVGRMLLFSSCGTGPFRGKIPMNFARAIIICQEVNDILRYSTNIELEVLGIGI